MHNYSLGGLPMTKGNKLSKDQCPKNERDKRKMANVPYSSIVDSLMYDQVCTCSDIAFLVGMLGRYMSNFGPIHY